MGYIRHCIDEAKDNQMLAWLYDEDRWPSGTAGGRVTAGKPEHARKSLLFTTTPYPEESLRKSQEPEAGEKPYTAVNLYARLKGYEQIEAENLQVFAETITNQNLEMIPLSEFPNQWDQTEIFNTPPQNL